MGKHIEPSSRQPDDPAIVVSSDSHCGPLLSQHLRPYCPRAHLDEFDAFAQAVEDGPMSAYDPSTVNASELRRTADRNILTEGGWDIDRRLQDMNDAGIAAEVIFHGLNMGKMHPMPFSVDVVDGSGVDAQDLELVAVGRHIYNRWLADFVSTEPERHAGLAHVPIWDIDAAVTELEWARSAGLRGVNFPRPRLGVTPYNHPDWDPFWSAAEALEMPLTAHSQTGGSMNAYFSEGDGNFPILMLEVFGPASRRAFHYLVFGGVFDRHPGLKLVFTEQPGLWWRSELADMDSLAMLVRKNNRMQTPGFDSRPPDRLPSEYARDHLFVGASFLAGFEAQDASRGAYASQVMWGSDYPHPEGVWQYPLTDDDEPMCRLAIRDTFTGLPLDDIAGMAGENAARVYGLDVDALRRVATRIGAPSLGSLAAPFDAGDEAVAESYRDGSFAFRRTGAYH